MIAGTATAAELAELSMMPSVAETWPTGRQVIAEGWDGEVIAIRLIYGTSPRLADGNKRARYLAQHGAGAMEIPVRVEFSPSNTDNPD